MKSLAVYMWIILITCKEKERKKNSYSYDQIYIT